MIFNCLGFFLFVGVPLGIAFILFGLDLTALSDMNTVRAFFAVLRTGPYGNRELHLLYAGRYDRLAVRIKRLCRDHRPHDPGTFRQIQHERLLS